MKGKLIDRKESIFSPYSQPVYLRTRDNDLIRLRMRAAAQLKEALEIESLQPNTRDYRARFVERIERNSRSLIRIDIILPHLEAHIQRLIHQQPSAFEPTLDSPTAFANRALAALRSLSSKLKKRRGAALNEVGGP